MLKYRACALLLGTAVSLQTAHVQAAPPAPKGAAVQAGEKDTRSQAISQARELLESDDVTKVQDGLTRLTQLKAEGVAVFIAERLRRGLPPQLADAAVDSLVELGDARAVPALLELTLHRRWQLRVKAITALATLRAQSIQSALLYALNDPSAEVRSAAVAALGQVGDQRAVPAVLAAFDRQVEGAASALGKLAAPRDMDALLTHVSGGDVARFAPAFEQMLIRERFPVASKLKLISALVQFGTQSAAACLARAQAALPANGDVRVAASLSSAVTTLPQPPMSDGAPTVVAAKEATP